MWIKPVVVISKCIEHDHCRFDGSMASSKEVKELMPFVEFVLVCPEMGIGLPSPRESLRLVALDGENRLLMNQSGDDKTDAMQDYVTKQIERLKQQNPDGFILKSRSPTCGIKDVKVYQSLGKSPCMTRSAKGLFGNQVINHFPQLSIEDEGRLTNFNIRDHFYTAIFARAMFKSLQKTQSIKQLIDFHSKNKYLFMAFSQNQLRLLGKIVANHSGLAVDVLYQQYETQLNQLLKVKPTKGRYINVMLHLFGYYSNYLNDAEKAHFLDLLEQYRNGMVPQLSVMSLLKSWALRFDETYVEGQTIFEPYPHELIHIRDSGKTVS